MADWDITETRILDQTPFGICVVDKNYRIQVWNRTLERWTGNTRAAVTNKELFRLFPHLDNKRYRSRLETVLQRGLPTIFSSQLHPNFFPVIDRAREQQTIVTRVPSPDDEPLILFCVIDMTTQVQQLNEINTLRKKTLDESQRREMLTEALEISEKRFKAQYKNMPIPTYTWEPNNDDFVLVDFNEAAGLLTHGALANALGMLLSQYAHEIPEMAAAVHKCHATRTYLREELTHHTKGVDISKSFVIHYAFVPPEFVMVHMEDITDHKIAEQERLELERMQVLLETIGGVCHNVNQPLTILSGYAEIMKKLIEDKPELQNINNKMMGAIHSIIDILKKLQNITRYERMKYVKGYILDINKASEKSNESPLW